MRIEDHLLSEGAAYGRSGKKLTPQGVVIHFVAKPGAGALEIRDYFENGAGGTGSSSHYIIGLNGEIIRCIPENERAAHAGKSYGSSWNAAANTNNSRFLGIECCHPNPDGKFNGYTVHSLTELVADICIRYDLDPLKDVYRHYDVSGKLCPLYYVNYPVEWKTLKNGFMIRYTYVLKNMAAAQTQPAAQEARKPAPQPANAPQRPVSQAAQRPSAQPAPSVQPALTAKPAPSVQPALTAKPAPSVQPAPAAKPAPSIQPAPIAKPAPAVQPATALQPAYTAQPAPAAQNPAPVRKPIAPQTPPSVSGAPSPEAAEAWNWASGYGIVDGTRPGAPARREDMAVMIYNFYRLLSKKR